jgi:streptogramin lyase
LQTVIEYPIPTANSQPISIVTGPDGNLWFTEYNTSKIGRITPAGVITEFTTPTTYSYPAGIAKGPDGNLWFAERQGNNIGKITPGGVIVEYPVPSGGPFGITAGPDGNTWFTDAYSGNVGKITSSGAVTVYQCEGLTSCGGAYSIAVGPDGNLWFGPQNNEVLAEVTTSGVYSNVGFYVGLGSRLSSPYGLTEGPDGNVWVTETANVVRVTPSGVMGPPYYASLYQLGSIAQGPDGNLWFTEEDSQIIAKITTGGIITEFSLGTDYDTPLGIAAGPDGNIWFTEETGNKIGTLLLAGPPSSAPAINPTSLSFSATAGGSAPASQTLNLTAATSISFTVSATTQVAPTWLSVTPSGTLNTNETLTVSVEPAGLDAGTYVGWITVVSGYVTETLTVTLTVSAVAGGNVIASPSSLSFAYTSGSAAPYNDELTITSAAGSSTATTYTVSTSVASPSGGNWLALSFYGTTVPNGTSEQRPRLFTSASTLPASPPASTPGRSPSPRRVER